MCWGGINLFYSGRPRPASLALMARGRARSSTLLSRLPGIASLNPAEDILKVAESQRSFDGFRRFNCFQTAAIFASLYAAFMCAATVVTQAQVAGGSITGTARGDSGSAMPGVRISIKDVVTGQVRTALTDTSGHYRVAAVPRGEDDMTTCFSLSII